MSDIYLKKNYNSWWQSKQIHGEPIDAARRMYQDILDGLERYCTAKSRKILDVACGTGEFLKEAKMRSMDIYGIDISDYAIQDAKKHIQGKFFVGSGEKLPFENNEFDLVTCIGSLEHFDSQERGISEMARVVKKNGVVLIHVPNLMFLGHIYMTYKYGVMPSEGKQSFSEVFYTYGGWKKLLEENGLKVIGCTVVNDMSETEKVNIVTKLLWQSVIRHIVPFHLSYAFNLYCSKK